MESSQSAIAANATVFISFCDEKGTILGDVISLQLTSTIAELTALLEMIIEEENDDERSTQQDDQKSGFVFYSHTFRITGSLADFMKEHPQISREKTLQIEFRRMLVSEIPDSKKHVLTLNGHTESVLCVAFSPNSLELASGSGDTTVRFWNQENGDRKYEENVSESPDSNSWVLVAQWSPNSCLLATGDMQGDVNIFNGIDGKKMTRKGLKGHKKWVTSLSWEPLHMNAKSSRVVSASKDCSIRVWQVKNDGFNSGVCVLAIAAAHEKSITKVIWGGQDRLYSASEDSLVKVWRSDGSLVQILSGHGGWVNTLSVNTEFVLKNTGGIVKANGVDSSEAALMVLREQASKVYNGVRKGESERLVSGSDDRSLIVWESAQIPEKKMKQQSQTQQKKKKQSNVIARLIGHTCPVNHAVFSPDGSMLASASFDMTVRLWSALNGKSLMVMEGHGASVYQIVWAPNGKYVASASKDSKVKVWSVAKMRLVRTYGDHDDEVYAVDWSGDGKYIVSGSKDRTLKVNGVDDEWID